MNTIFDIGSYDGADTEYYLSLGFSVISVEAHPEWAQKIKNKLSNFIKTGKLIVLNNVVWDRDGISININESDNAPQSTTQTETIRPNSKFVASYNIKSITLRSLIHTYGIPHYIKIDIEGNERIALSTLFDIPIGSRPIYTSVEMDYDKNLMYVLEALGYSGFCTLEQFMNFSGPFGEMLQYTTFKSGDDRKNFCEKMNLYPWVDLHAKRY